MQEGNTGKVVVVDDEETNLRVFEAILTKGGYETVGTLRPEGAAELCSEQNGPVPLAVVDVKMPGMSGVEVARRLLELQPAIRFLFVSGTPFVRWSAQEREGARALAPGSWCLLPKPFPAQSLMECVECLLGGQSQLPQCPKHCLCLPAATRS